LGQVSLFKDINKNRILDGDQLIGIGYFSDSKMNLTGLDIALPPESLSYFFVTADLPLNVIDNDSLAIEIANPSDLIFTDNVNINGDLPLTSGSDLIINGSISDQYNVIETISPSLSPGDTSVTLFSFYPALNGDQPDALTELTLTNTYDADTSEFSSLELWIDNNGDNTWQSSDIFITTFNYISNAWITNPFSIPVEEPASALFVIGDVSATATANTKFKAEIPINGCQFSSANDGPRDDVIISENTFVISNSALKIQYTPLPST
jgi:hypothetical protein